MRGTERVYRRLLHGGSARVGRDPDNDVAIDHLSVSRHHCTVEWRSTAFWLTDAGSANGTKVNGQLVVNEQELHHGDRIGVGDFDILFGSGAEAKSDLTRGLEGRAASLEVDGDVGVVESPQDADAKEPKANEEGLAVVELHGSLDMVGWAAV
jgi:pSer/pThr/pTyr-binding forkhead associated (FHA) protein